MNKIKNIKYNKVTNSYRGETMTGEPPVISDEKRRVEKVVFKFDNPGDVEIEAPVINCEKTGKKFFHPDDVDNVLDSLEKEYKRVHKKLGK